MIGRPTKDKRIDRVFSRIDAAIHNLSSFTDDDVDAPTFQRFVEGFQIITKTRGQQSLILNRSQEQVWHLLLGARERKIAARFICLKSRQLGISTLIEAFLFGLTYHRSAKRALVAAHLWESSLKLFAMSKFFYENLSRKQQKKRPLKSSTNQQLVYAAPHNSILQVSTANASLGRSGTFQYVHRSEVAFWQDAEEASTAVAQCIPMDWDTLDFWESTAHGSQNLFADTWRAAEAGDNGYTPIFLTWKAFPEYFFIWKDTALSPQELEYQRKYELSEGEIGFAAQKRRRDCGNSWEKFHAEYPVVPEVAFQYSGYPWFDPSMITAQLKNRPESGRGRMEWQSKSDPVVEFVLDDVGPVEIWRLPEIGAEYVIGVDIGEGVGAAYTVVQVFRRPSPLLGGPSVQVAKFRSNRIRPEDSAEQIYMLGCFYNWAFVAVECNNHGHSTLAALRMDTGFVPQMWQGYPELYYHVRRDRKTQEDTKKVGWATDKVTRPLLFNRFKKVWEDEDVTINSTRTLSEMAGIVFDPESGDAGMWAQTYKNPDTRLYNDDEVLAAAIAIQMIDFERSAGSVFIMPDSGY